MLRVIKTEQNLSIIQIVRADLKELRDLDLEGAPYGYTPFCDSRREMDGYRFWKTGYWASHLGHRKYHIRSRKPILNHCTIIISLLLMVPFEIIMSY